MSTMDREQLSSLRIFAESQELAYAAMNWGIWPHGQCAVISALTVPLVRLGWPDKSWWVEFGWYDSKGHCWISGELGIIVDITVRQFDEDAPLVAQYPDKYQPWSLLTDAEEDILRRSIKSRRYHDNKLTAFSGGKARFAEMRRQRA